MVSSSGARDILQQSSSCDAAVSLRGPDRQCSKDDSPGKRAQEQVENYWQDPGEQLWVKPKGLLKGTYGLFKSIKNTAQIPIKG